VILIGGLGTSLGEMIGYLLGRSGREIINVDAKNKKILQWYDKKPYLIVLLFSFIPIPVFDVIGICAGMTKTNPIKFWLCCFIGKTIKMALFVFVFSLFKDFISCFL
jgi:membrane protein YqaA with SNARE-associated domain